jgi:hypothetical protein
MNEPTTSQPALFGVALYIGQSDIRRRRTDIPVCRRGRGVKRADADAARVLDRQECLSSCGMPSMFDSLEVQVLSQPDGGEG